MEKNQKDIIDYIKKVDVIIAGIKEEIFTLEDHCCDCIENTELKSELYIRFFKKMDKIIFNYYSTEYELWLAHRKQNKHQDRGP